MSNIQYTVKIKKNKSTQLSSQAQLSAQQEGFKRDYYDLTAWNLSANGTGTSYPVDGSIIAAKDTTIYAQWKPIDYSITYDAGEGTHGNPAIYNVETPTITLQPATKYQHESCDWYDESTSPMTLVTSIPRGSHGDRQLSASYIRTRATFCYSRLSCICDVYTLSSFIDKYGYSHGKDQERAEQLISQGEWAINTNAGGNNSGVAVKLRNEHISKISAWSTNEIVYSNSQSSLIFMVTNSGSGQGYSHKSILLNETYVKLSAEYAIDISDNNVEINKQYVISSQSQLSTLDSRFCMEGYVISAWTENADGTGKQYAPEQVIASSEVSADINLWAQWARRAISVTYHPIVEYSQSGSPVVLRQTVVDVAPSDSDYTLLSREQICAILQTPEYIGKLMSYTISSWTENEDGTGRQYNPEQVIPAADLTGDITLYSQIPQPLTKITYTDGTSEWKEISGGLYESSLGDNIANISRVEIGNLVTLIGRSVFFNCADNLSSVAIPSSVTSIGGNAFRYCYRLSSIEIPASVLSIGGSALAYCTGLTSVAIPSSVTNIENDVFYNCTGLMSVTIPSSVASIGNQAFMCCGKLKRVKILSSVASIGSEAFRDCSGLTSVVIPEGVSCVGSFAFANCTSMRGAYVPSTVTQNGLGAFAFLSCHAQIGVTFGGRARAQIDYMGYRYWGLLSSQCLPGRS